MREDTRRSLHFGVNFHLTPKPDLSPKHLLSFQGKLAEENLLFDQVIGAPPLTNLIRRNTPLQVTVAQTAPPIVQLLIVAALPGRRLDDFIDEAEAIVQAYRQEWPGPIQVVRQDVTIRHLYSTSETHAFQFLWEERLGQSSADLEAFQRGVLGGGLRFVMPRKENLPGEPTVEVKIESYLQDSANLFVDTQFVWELLAQGAEPDPRSVLTEVEEYAVGPVMRFINGER